MFLMSEEPHYITFENLGFMGEGVGGSTARNSPPRADGPLPAPCV